MIIKIYSIYTSSFIKNKVPQLIRQSVAREYTTNLHRYKGMEFYINKKLNIKKSFMEILYNILDGMYVSIEDDYYLIKVTSPNRIDRYSVNGLVNLIEYGNQEIRGTHILEKSIRKVIDNLPYLFN